MAVKIRLKRMGRTHRPFYRVHAINGSDKRDGRALEQLGHYDPIESDKDKQFVCDLDATKKWLDNGAIPSETVSSLLKKAGFEHKMLRLPRPGKPKKTEEADGEAKAD
jgi:small subunit ribosomal protein S16